MKRSNIEISGIEEREEFQQKGHKHILNKVIEEIFPNLKKDMSTK